MRGGIESARSEAKRFGVASLEDAPLLKGGGGRYLTTRHGVITHRLWLYRTDHMLFFREL
jgi:hypothetical protein